MKTLAKLLTGLLQSGGTMNVVPKRNSETHATTI
jgi:hypothetical protein